jgi:phosphoserine phosphatase
MAKYKLVCFDVDGTLVDNVVYSWELFHNYFKVDMKKREEIRKKYYNNEIDYLDWARHDMGMWMEKGATKKDFFKAMEKLKLMEGAMETILELKKHKIKLAIVSGSLDIILEKFIPNYKEIFDDVFLSRMIFDKVGKLVDAKVTQYDMIKKRDALRKVAKREGIALKDTVHIGDHHNDVAIAKIAGLSIAFDCKDDELRRIADVVIDKKDLRETLRYII